MQELLLPSFKKVDPKVDVIIIEKSSVLGYVASSLNLVLEGYIQRLEDSKTATASELLSEGINVMLNSEVTKSFRKNKRFILSHQRNLISKKMK